MKNKPNTNTQISTTTQITSKAKSIKLGIDVHAESYRVVRQVDHATPQPAQKFSPQGFLLWAKKQPQNWDELHKGVKTDKTDALALAQRLSRYVDGNKKELAVIRVPTVEQELARSQSRQREQLLSHRLRLEAQGRSLLLFNGLRVKGRWWQAAQWSKVQGLVSAPLRDLLIVFRDLLVAVQTQLTAATARLESAATAQPCGVGALTSQVLEREILDWKCFNNRRQVASLTGMCPGVHSSGFKSRGGPITKHGNRRLRTALIELAWRCLYFQPEYPPLKKWRAVLLNAKATGAIKKKAIVAVGRRLAIDLWRLNTGRATVQKLGLKSS